MTPSASKEPVFDDFERPRLGDNWTVYNGDVGIVGDRDLGVISKVPELSGLGLVTWTATTLDADQFSEAVISSDADRQAMFQVFVRRRASDKARYGFHCVAVGKDGQPADPWWGLKLDGIPNGRDLAKVAAPRLMPGDVIRIEVAGHVIKGFHNGVEIIRATDSTLVKPGEPGMALNVGLVNSFPTPLFSSWRGGSLHRTDS
jgi:hypothetical protein